MRSVKRLDIVVVTAAAGLVLTGAPANAALVNANPCPPGYYGVVIGSDLTGNAYVCENVF